MKQPKYKIGDKVWRMKDSKVVEEEVVGVKMRECATVKSSFTCDKCGIITYGPNHYEGYVYLPKEEREHIKIIHSFDGGKEEQFHDKWLEEGKVFPTKQALIDSL